MTRKSEIGKKGEDFAANYLTKNGYKVIARNFREKWGELDIIAKAPDKTLVFVEVKTISSGSFGGLKPEDQVSAAKLRKFKRIAALYAGNNEELIDEKRGWRLDLIAIELGAQKPIVRHYENIS
jgi:putative endonuclease